MAAARAMVAALAGAASAPVTLDEMLRAREQRVARQQDALARFAAPVVSATLVMPGPVKDTPSSRFVMATAAEALPALFRRQGWRVLFDAVVQAATGAEALYVVEADALDLKRALVALEDAHGLGRLWDLDVICPRAGGVSRRALSLEPRRCLVCDEPGHACARSRRHPLAEVLAAFEERVRGYRLQ